MVVGLGGERNPFTLFLVYKVTYKKIILQGGVMASLGTTSLLQNTTFLQNAFITTFLTTLGFETVRYILGKTVFHLVNHSFIR